jgi:flavin-dependent dehydrogenase
VQSISEIIVAGNGLSGISTVVSLSQKGHSVTWINEGRKESNIPWTESIQLRSLDYLSNFVDLKNILQATNIPQDSNFSCWGSDELIQKHITSKASHEEDLILIDKAEFVRLIKKNLNYQQAISGRVKKIIRKDGYCEVEISDNRILRCHTFVDSTGSSSKLLDPFWPWVRVDNFPIMHWKLFKTDRKNPVMSTFLESTNSGWWYAAPTLNGGLSLLYATSLNNLMKPSALKKEFLREQINETLHLKHWIKELGLRHFSTPIVRQHHIKHKSEEAPPQSNNIFPHIFANGDAAASLDPLSSHGSTSGIWSAQQTSSTIDSISKREQIETLHGANQHIEAIIKGHLPERARFYQAEQRFNSYDFWAGRCFTYNPRQNEHKPRALPQNNQSEDNIYR